MRAAAVGLLILGASGAALADSVTVTTLADVSDGDTSSISALQSTPGTDGEISLREAVTASNNTTGPNAIDFDPALSGGTIVLTAGALQPTVSVTISGPGADKLTISGDHSSRIIDTSPVYLPGVVAVDITIQDLRLTGGWSNAYGGAIYFFGSGNGDDSLHLKRVVIDDHQAPATGTTITFARGVFTMDGCAVKDGQTSAAYSMYFQDSQVTISNTTFSGTLSSRGIVAIATNDGYGTSGSATVEMIHSTFVNEQGPVVALQSYDPSALQECLYVSSVFTGGSGPRMAVLGPNPATFESLGSNVLSDTSGDSSPPPSDQLNTDPLLGPLEPSHGTYIFPLATDSPALDTADAAACTAAPVSATDQRGVARPQGAGCDVGAAELIPPLYVDVDAAPGGDGSSWATAMQYLQDALAAAVPGSQIWVAEGLYLPDAGTGQVDDDPTSTFTIPNGVEVYGGFGGTESLVAERDIAAHTTILSGDLQGDDTNPDGNSVAEDWNDIQGTNANHVVNAGGTDASTILDGVTVTAGDVCGDGGGAGIRCSGGGGPTLRNLIVSGNRAICGAGGGGVADCSSALVTGSRFTGSYSVGGGAWNGGGTFVDSMFVGNESGAQAGAVAGVGVTMTRCELIGNHARRGGAMAGEAMTLESVLISGNNADDEWGGGLLIFGGGASRLTNVTIAGNDGGNGDDVGGGIHFSGSGALEVMNSIIWNNRDMTGTNTLSSGLYDANLGSVTVSNSILSGSGGSTAWTGGTIIDGGGNLDQDPLFAIPVDPTTAPTDGGNLHLRTGSPAVDAGDDLAVTTATDLDGNDRIQDTAVDLGAYEGVVIAADLSVSLSDGVTAAVPGEGVTYTLVVHNDGPDGVATVGLSDTFPAELSCAWTSVATGGATGNTDDSGDIAETLDLPSSSTVTYTVSCTIDPAATGTLVDTASLTADVVDATTGDHSATDDDTVLAPSADLAVTAGSSCWAQAGESILLQIRVDSSGPSTALGATVTTSLATDLTGCTWSCVPSGGASCTATPPSGNLFDTVDLPPSGSLDYSATCLVDPGSTSDQLTTVVTVTPPAVGADDPVMTNNTVIEQTPGPWAIFADCFESGGVDGWSTSTG